MDMDIKPRLLVVDDEEEALDNLTYVLKKEGYAVTAIQNGPEALKRINKEVFDLVITDLRMEKVDGLEILHRTKELHAGTEVIMITAFATVDTAIKAMKQGAYHYIAKPYKLDEVRKVVREALEKSRLRKENLELKEKLSALEEQDQIITNNTDMKRLLALAAQVAVTDCNILIQGESGTGKELLAQLIHTRSKRHDGPLVSVNCGVFTEELLTNELFGHEKGAFTGAGETKKGLLESAHTGTMFLDEITEMSPGMQVKLLRVTQEQEVMRVGGTVPIAIDVRFIAATNRNIQEEVQEGRFRSDLYFRINVVSLRLPALAQRKDDIPLLAEHFLRKYTKKMGKSVTEIAPDALKVLKDYDYPGNVRELENIIERGVALAPEEVIETKHLPDDIRFMNMEVCRPRDDKYLSLADQEKAYIAWLLKELDDNKTECAKILGIDRVSLWRKMKKYGMV